MRPRGSSFHERATHADVVCSIGVGVSTVLDAPPPPFRHTGPMLLWRLCCTWWGKHWWAVGEDEFVVGEADYGGRKLRGVTNLTTCCTGMNKNYFFWLGRNDSCWSGNCVFCYFSLSFLCWVLRNLVRGHLLKKEEISAIFLGYIVKFKLPSHTHTDIIVRQLIVEDSQNFRRVWKALLIRLLHLISHRLLPTTNRRIRTIFSTSVIQRRLLTASQSFRVLLGAGLNIHSMW